LNLAQYRELESFSQFGSDLDEDTKNTLERGKRITEVMKQAQYSPIAVSKQVAFIYAVNSGALDHLKVTEIAKWKEGFGAFLEASKQALLTAIAKGWTEAEESELKSAITEFASMNVA
jgi:F0F1-type ATP synthase alpha subunit